MTKQPDSDRGIEAWEMVLRVHSALVPVMEKGVERATDLPLSWYDVLYELNQVPSRRLRMSELGERVVLSRSRVSRVVDDMARADMVAKESDAGDGRGVHAVLTPKGRTALRKAAPIYLDLIRTRFSSHITDHEAEVITEALSRVMDTDH